MSDFGTARYLKADSSNWNAIAGTYGYVAPGKADNFLFQYLFFIEKCSTSYIDRGIMFKGK